MSTAAKASLNEMQSKLSTLWVFMMLLILFRDMHELFRPGLLTEMISGTVGGLEMSEPALLTAGIAVSIMISMVVWTRFLPYRYNRWSNLIIAPLAVLGQMAAGVKDMDDIWFLSLQLITLVAIFVIALRWRSDDEH
ncbi:DUF6326 family protein [Maritalea sp.]|jgi:hypothetical protein|uniref:DUF6326 family protein n=1 Tax=Maritalea sp. TaxID=2003361 RepID=UPI0039E56CC4